MPTSTLEKQTISFSKLIPDFKHFVFKSNTRPSLKNVYNNGTNLYATDSQIALRLNNSIISDNIYKGCYNPKTDVFDATIHYNDIDRVFPDLYSYNYNISLNKKQITELLSILKEAKKIVNREKNKVIILLFNNHSLQITSYSRNENNSFQFNQTYDNISWDQDQFKISVNVQLLIYALQAAKKILNAINKNSTISWNLMNNNLRPFSFTLEDKFIAMIMPVRTIK